MKEVAMSRFREKAQGITKQTAGQMIGDELLVREGNEQVRRADRPAESDADDSDRPREAPQAIELGTKFVRNL
jgi:hypothetical protein